MGLEPLSLGKTPVTPEWRPYTVPTAFKKIAERRGARCANASNAVQTPRTPCGGIYFEHAQNKRHGLAFPQRVRQYAVAMLWQRCGVF